VISERIDRLAGAIVQEVWEHIPGYSGPHMRRRDLEQAVRANLLAALAALAEDRELRADELRWAIQLGEQRALQGVAIDAMLESWRMAERTVVDVLLAHGEELTVATLRQATGATGRAFDQLTRASVASYRRTQEEITVHFERVTADLVARLATSRNLDREQVLADARRVDVDPDRPYNAVALGFAAAATPSEVQRAHRHVLATIAAESPGRILTGSHHGYLLLVVPARPNDGLHAALLRALGGPPLGAQAARPERRRADGAIAGIGEERAKLWELGPSCAQACVAVEIGLRTSATGPVVRYDDVLPEAILLNDRDAATRLLRSRLDPLLERGSLLATLRAYLRCGLSVRRAAEALGVHENTVSYRLDRVRELTGRDLRDMLSLADVTLALRALDVFGPRPDTRGVTAG
jgi:PucR C-terminal helix-turn-helix domain/GGDEF-like domain